MITGPVSLVITNQVNGHFAFIAFTIICCCFLTLALVFTPKIVELARRRGAQMAFGGSHLNGTFHETLSLQEQQDKFQKLVQENDDLTVSQTEKNALFESVIFNQNLSFDQNKIAEKEHQIEDVRKQIEEITRQRRQQRIEWQTKGVKKAVRICEPESEPASMSESDANNNNKRSSVDDIRIERNLTNQSEEDSTVSAEQMTTNEQNIRSVTQAEAVQIIEEEECDFVRVESTATDSGYMTSGFKHSHSAKMSEFELSESYL